MVRLTISLFTVGVMAATAAIAQAQLPLQFPTQASDLLNTTALRDQFLSQAGIDVALIAEVDDQCRAGEAANHVNPLGFATIPLPNYLRSPALELSPACGCLVTHVNSQSVAELAGLRPGMTIVEFDGQPVASTADLRTLSGVHSLLVITEDGLRNLDFVVPGPPALFHQPVPNPLAQTLRSLSVSEANGVIAMAAIVDTDNGPERVELKGTRQQVETQLQQLSPRVQEALRPHLR